MSYTNQIYYCPEGLTVKKLKELLADWPETNPRTGEDCEVWLGQGTISNPVKLVAPLNSRIHDDGSISADLLIEVG